MAHQSILFVCCVHKWNYIMHAKWLNLYENLTAKGIIMEISSPSWYITQKSNKGARQRYKKSFSILRLTHSLFRCVVEKSESETCVKS